MARTKAPGGTGRVRIIGGRWRGRRIELPPGGQVRPTGDRIRETLFNWLAPIIEGARCLDLYAGSGALGLEALSRGAGAVVFVERDPAAVEQLEHNLGTLGAGDAVVLSGDATNYLAGAPTGFDIVFLDPPFGSIELGNLCTLLEHGWLAPGARIYLESDRRVALPELPPGWVVDREKAAGRVRFALARRP